MEFILHKFFRLHGDAINHKENHKKQSGCFLHLLGHSYGKYVQIIGSKAPRKYSASSWSDKTSILLCAGQQKLKIHDLWISDPWEPLFIDLSIPEIL